MKLLRKNNPQQDNADNNTPLCETAYELRHTPQLRYHLRKECIDCPGINPECNDYRPAILRSQA